MGSVAADRARSRRSPLIALVCGLLVVGAAVGLVVAVRPHPVVLAPAATAVRSGASRHGIESALVVPRAMRAAPSPGAPRRLRVPRLGVDAAVASITARGSVLTPPADPKEVGWWSDGAEPGAGRGRVLITGHTVHTGGGALDNLNELRHGDLVGVAVGRRWLRYRVERRLVLSGAQVAARSAHLFRQHGPERLVLVTCEGWNGATYAGSTVVVAEPV